MQTMQRITPRDTIKYHWWQVMCRDHVSGKIERVGGINSERGAQDWADRLNANSLNRHFWAEPNPNMPGSHNEDA